MGTIYTDQELILNATDLQGRDMDTIDFRVDYWAPANNTKTPTGTIDTGDITTTPASSVVNIKVAKNIMSTHKVWRFQVIENPTEIGWTVICVTVEKSGKCQGNF